MATSKTATKAPQGLKRPATFDHLKGKQPLERTVKIYLDQEAVEDYEAAAELGHQDKINEAQARLDESTATLRFQQIGRKRYDEILRAHPPVEDDPDDKDSPYHAESFAPHLVSESCVEPQMSIEQVTELFDEWNTSELMELFMAAMEVNTQRRVVNLGKAYG